MLSGGDVMIQVKMFGGLGNQMFQYAFAQYLRLNNNEVKINISDYRIHEHHNGFELGRVFGIRENIETKICHFAVNNSKVLNRLIAKLYKIRLSNEHEIYENNEAMSINASCFQEDLYFIGFWQNLLYVNPVEEKLKSTFVFPDLDRHNKEFIESLKDAETVSLHVRRGDYLKEMNLKSVCDRDYYHRAIDTISEHVESPQFVIFSDDPEWCRTEFDFINPIIVDWNKGENSFRDMQLMSICKHNIIANSTFSWWGAWLNQNTNKKVIIPMNWFVGRPGNTLINNGWISV